MFENLLNVFKSLFHILKVKGEDFVKTQLALSDISFYLIRFRLISRTRVEIQDTGGFPGKKNKFISSQYAVSFTRCGEKIYESSTNWYYITQLTH